MADDEGEGGGRRERESENGRDGENVGIQPANEPALFARKKRNSFTPAVFGGAAAIRPGRIGNDVGCSIDNKIAGPMISERKGAIACRRRRAFARACIKRRDDDERDEEVHRY